MTSETIDKRLIIFAIVISGIVIAFFFSLKYLGNKLVNVYYGTTKKYTIKPEKGKCITKESIHKGVSKYITTFLIASVILWALCYIAAKHAVRDGASLIHVGVITLLIGTGIPALFFTSARFNFFPGDLILKKYFSVPCSRSVR